MYSKTFEELCGYVQHKIKKKNTKFKQSISVKERVAVTIRFLATGHTFRALSFEFRIGRETISEIVKETCEAIWDTMRQTFLPDPSTLNWQKVSEEFESRSNFPHCIGAIDGKHIRIVNPNQGGSLFFNYKNYYSIILLALVDANYCFTAIDVGSYGRCSDSNIFKNSALYKKLHSKSLNIPAAKSLPNFKNIAIQYVAVADEAFGISEYVLRPYARKNLETKKRVFNYRLSRARRFVECTFGIFANKWRIFHTAINLDETFVKTIILSCAVLHNFVRQRDGYQFEDTLTCPFDDIPIVGTGGGSLVAKQTRDVFADYFISPSGSVPWQYNKI
nr:unnamed protein product [Callosobruchus chinensis]